MVLLLVGVCALAPAADAQEAIFVVRHAERADQSADARLSADGMQRANALRDRLRAAGITQIFTTDLRRTIDTATPLAELRRLPVQELPAADPDATVARVAALRSTDRALVVGHSNTIPALLRRFHVDEDVAIGDGEYDNIFVVIPRTNGPALLLRLKY
jgi:broad specificity phosphatase PhoE